MTLRLAGAFSPCPSSLLGPMLPSLPQPLLQVLPLPPPLAYRILGCRSGQSPDVGSVINAESPLSLEIHLRCAPTPPCSFFILSLGQIGSCRSACSFDRPADHERRCRGLAFLGCPHDILFRSIRHSSSPRSRPGSVERSVTGSSPPLLIFRESSPKSHTLLTLSCPPPPLH